MYSGHLQQKSSSLFENFWIRKKGHFVYIASDKIANFFIEDFVLSFIITICILH